MKKYWGILLAAVMIVALTGCAKIGIGKPDDVPGDISDPPKPQTLSAPSSPGEEQIAETVLYDEGGIKITAHSLDVVSYGIWYPELALTIDNNTSADIKVYPDYCSVNNYRAGAFLSDSASIAPGSSLSTTMELYFKEGAEETGTDYIVYIDLNFEVIDSETYDTINWIGPLHLETTAAEIATPTYNDKGAVVVDNSDVKIVLDELVTDDFGDQYQECFVYNKRSEPIGIEADSLTVNGQAFDANFVSSCDSGKYDMNWIYFYQSDLEAAGIEEITELGLVLVVYDSKTYDTIYKSDLLSVTYN